MVHVPTFVWNEAPGAAVTLVVRPEMVSVDAPAPHATGIVRRSAFLGNAVEYDLEIGGELITVADHDPGHGHVHPEGSQVAVRLREDALYVLPEST